MNNSTTPVVGITASELFKKSKSRIAQELVKDLVKTIDAEIGNAHNAGFNNIKFELPINFQVNNLSKKDAQILIYSELLMMYRNSESNGGKGFKNTTIMGTEPPILIVAWRNGMNEDERTERADYIEKCRV